MRLNKSVLSSCLKLLLLTARSQRLSSREFQTVGPAAIFSKTIHKIMS